MPPDDPHQTTLETLSTRDVRTLLGLLTEDEVARAIGIVGPTLKVWRQRGHGPAFFRFKRNLFYRTADVTQWLIDNTVDPETDDYVVPRPDTTRERIYEEYPGGPEFRPIGSRPPADPEKIIAELDRMVDKLNQSRPPDDQLQLDIHPRETEPPSAEGAQSIKSTPPPESPSGEPEADETSAG